MQFTPKGLGLLRKDGSAFVIPRILMQDSQALLPSIAYELARLRLPDLITRLQNGESLSFGSLKLNQKGIVYQDTSIPVEQIKIVRWKEFYGPVCIHTGAKRWEVSNKELPLAAPFLILMRSLLSDRLDQWQIDLEENSQIIFSDVFVPENWSLSGE